ncbi:MAG: glutamine-hydrolyzing GMP synthase [Candidatus Diapherotrites archaeon]|nr:glutamine-hydrolyzing GMP synthase [Candidatus Diapherotrites archaeon]
MPQNRILVLDFGSQYTHLLARRIRQLGVYSEILPPTASSEQLSDCKGIILSGGPRSVYEENAPAFNPDLFRLNRPILGLCYGLQLMVQQLGGKVEKGTVKEYGKARLQLAEKSPLFASLETNQLVWMSHGDKATELPAGFKVLGKTPDCDFAAIADEKRKLFALQFHPEVTHTPNGLLMLKNFVLGTAKCEQNWSAEAFLEQEIKKVRTAVGSRKVFLLVSGGIDSTVCAALFGKALPADHLVCFHVDSGFMRKDESRKVKESLAGAGINLQVLNASMEFFERLQGVSDPERKRIIIGELFVELAERELEKMAGNEKDQWLLGQGTIYPDTIESGGTVHADKIKTHHNQVPLIQELTQQGRIIEPLRQLYKDEVRELARLLKLPDSLIERHPFPGPGLAIRALCGPKLAEDFNELETRMNAFLKEKKFRGSVRVLPLKGVGVQGDERTYRWVAALQGEFNHETLENLSTSLVNAFREINRVVWLIEPRQMEEIVSREANLVPERIKLLQEADALVNRLMDEAELHGEIWQFPVILGNVEVNEKPGEVIILRPVTSVEAMTAQFAWLDRRLLFQLGRKLMEMDGISAVFLDVTNKPPATIEWE